ncbi:MAG: hybrid sensor histidine kinase/response regulator [Cyanobacteria bacterium CRU_2_1]|nr:hybrid sensor histidine kinase/response regulator [Cyanobacteria bacterium CRU_2_1]
MPLDQTPKIDRILAVDDSPDNLFLVQTILEDSGYEIYLAEDGITALAQIEHSPPDLILLDVMMPGMDGYEVTRRIRRNKKLAHIPILLITAHEKSSVVEGLDAGADDFIRKPVDVDELLARVRSLLRLKHSIDEREHMMRQREDFVSRLTHDLRTPLVAADRMLHLILQDAFGEIPTELYEAVATMIRSNQNLLHMVNTLLEVYRHEAGRKNLTFSPCNLQDMVQDVVQELSPLASDRGLTLAVESEESESGTGNNQTTTVLGDYIELRRVLTNLVGNAIKFTDEGEISIRLIAASVKPASRVTKSWVTVEVEDTGVGIALEEQAMLFEWFRQGNHKRSGSGLGLHLSRRIIEAHQGTIEVQSEPKQGSVFTIRLPALLKPSFKG